MSFIFGGDTGKSYEDIKRQRAIADRLVASQGKAPRNVGEGLTAIGNALAARSLGKKAEARSAELDAEWAETAGGFGIDPARMEIIKNLPYEQRQMYMLNYMDKQDALRRRGSGSGSGKMSDEARMALVEQLMGGSQAGAAPAPADVGGFDMAQAVTGSAPLQMPDFQPGTPVEQTPMLDQKGMTPMVPNVPPVVSTQSDVPAIPGQQDNMAEIADYLAQVGPPQATQPDVASALAPPAPQPVPLPDISAPIAMPEQPQQGLSFGLPEAPQQASTEQPANSDPYAEQRETMTAQLMRIQQQLPMLSGPQEKVAKSLAASLKAQLDLLPDAPTAPKPTQDGVVYRPDGKGGFIADVIPGSPADLERKAFAAKQASAAQSATENEQTRQSVVLNAAGKIKDSLTTTGMFDLPEVGIIGSKLGGVNQEAADVHNQLTTLKGMVVFDRLEKLKQASKTGASGLGQVTEKEIDLLAAQLGTLDPSSSVEVLLDTIETVEDVFGKLSPEAEAYLTGKTDVLPSPSAGGGVSADQMTTDEYLKSLGLE